MLLPFFLFLLSLDVSSCLQFCTHRAVTNDSSVREAIREFVTKLGEERCEITRLGKGK